jgi:hypothetical protein
MKKGIRIRVIGFAAFVFAVARSSLAAEEQSQLAPALAGTWRWRFAMPDGSIIRPKLILKLEDGKIGGTTSFRSGTEASITNAALKGDELRFLVTTSARASGKRNAWIEGFFNFRL